MNVVITGASKGIGKSIAVKYVEEGCNIFICARNKDDLEKTVEELSIIDNTVEIFYSVVDMQNKEDVKIFAEDIKKEFGQIDVLINNAGSFVASNVYNEEDGILEEMIASNLYSAYYLTRALLPIMIAQKSGHIFNICSVASLKAYENGGSYSISKFALLGFSKNLRQELMPFHIKVTAVLPGATMSSSWADSNIDENRIMQSTDISNIIWQVNQLSPQAVVEEIIMRPMLGDL